MNDNSSIQDRLSEMLAEEGPTKAARMGHASRCVALYLVKRGFDQSLVAKTFGISTATMSHLANCEKNGRYAKVVDELRALGHQGLGEKYCTTDILDRMQRFRVDRPARGDLMRGRGAIDSADSHAGQWAADSIAGETTFTVYWHPDGKGWTMKLDEQESFVPERFRTSLQACKFGYWSFNPDAPEQPRRPLHEIIPKF